MTLTRAQKKSLVLFTGLLAAAAQQGDISQVERWMSEIEGHLKAVRLSIQPAEAKKKAA